MASNEKVKKLTQILGREMSEYIPNMDDEVLDRYLTVLNRPNVNARVTSNRAPFGISLNTPFGNIQMDSQLTIEHMYINGTRFTIKDSTIDGLEALVGDVDSVKSVLGETQGYQKKGRRTRNRRMGRRVNYQDTQELAFEELDAAGITYDNLFDELGGLLLRSNLSASDIADELFSNKIEEKDIAQFLTYESQYRNEIITRATNVPIGYTIGEYNFEPVQADDSFIGRLITTMGVTEAEYDAENGAVRIGDRVIHNLPSVDENGIFSNGPDRRYIPYHIGYFAEGEGSRIDRLRVIDPVQAALDSVKLQYDMTRGDIKFKTILDVTRNLADYENHPYGDEILETLKKKVVIDKSYLTSNSLLAEYKGRSDDLGAVALTMLDDDAKGVIDPLGTSNGSNMGVIFYLTKDAEINPDGSITPGEERYSPVGEVLSQYHVDKDNFNRNQMSFNALLTSTDVKLVNVAYAELGMYNAEDALVMTKAGAEIFEGPGHHQKAKAVGDKLGDMAHGNKGVVSYIADPDAEVTDELEQSGKAYLNQLAKDNPDLHMVASPISMASRMNMGVLHEGLMGEKRDLIKPNGEVVKDGITQMMYMSMPQTAEHKSKDYGVDAGARKYSSLFRYALSSKIGDELYGDAFLDQGVIEEHVDEVATRFQRMGVTFGVEDENLARKGNVYLSVQAPVTVSADEFVTLTPAVVRKQLKEQMVDGQINIDLGDVGLVSPMTKAVMKDEYGRNILPIRVSADGNIPYRYNELFEKIALNNESEYQKAYDRAVGNDYSQLTRKDNLLKNIRTMKFEDGARTEVLIPDPSLGLNQARSGVDDRLVVAHRDPAIKSGNTLAFENVGSVAPGVVALNPLIFNQQDADVDGDTEGVKDTKNLSDEQRDMLFHLANPTENLNHYGEVNASLGGHFKAMALASGEDVSDIQFTGHETNAEIAHRIENHMANMLTNPNTFGAYALSFTDENTVLDSLGRLADDGIKGDREEMVERFNHGYGADENRQVMKALIAKSEWTGLAGAITNSMIASFSDRDFDAELVRTTFDLTHTMSQSVLQMKKNAEKLPIIDSYITEMKAVMAGKYPAEDTVVEKKNGPENVAGARSRLLHITNGLIPERAVHKFVDMVKDRQASLPFKADDMSFGDGVLNGIAMNTSKLAYVNGNNFANTLIKLAGKSQAPELTDDDMADLASLMQTQGM